MLGAEDQISCPQNDPEWSLLCRCIVDYAAQVPTKIHGQIDWSGLLRLAHRHRIQPLLAVQLDHDANRSSASRQTLDALTAFRRINALRTLQLAAAQAELLALFREERVKAYVLKGLPIASKYYREASDRHAGDIDLLLTDPQDCQRVDTLIRGLGYQAFGALVENDSQGRLQRELNAAKKEQVYQSPCQTFLVEVHWANPQVPVFSSELLSAYMREQVHVHCQGVNLAIPPNDVLLEYLLWHGARSKWFRLKWLADVYLLMVQSPELKEGVEERAAAGSVPAMLGATLLGALFGTSLEVPVNFKSRFAGWVTYRYLRNDDEMPKALDKALDIPFLMTLKAEVLWRRYVLLVLARRLLRRIVWAK